MARRVRTSATLPVPEWLGGSPLAPVQGTGMDDFLASPVTKRRVGTGASRSVLGPYQAALLDARRRAASGDWGGARGGTLVGLYAHCHHLVYGVEPEELKDDGEFRIAACAAMKFLEKHAAGDAGDAADVVKWVWERERWRRERARSGGEVRQQRLVWRFVFAASTASDYRVAVAGRRTG